MFCGSVLYLDNAEVPFLAHLSRRLVVELIVYTWSGVRRRRPSSSSTISNMNISATSGPIATKFYLKHHWVGERLHLVLGQIRLELWFPWQQKAPIGL